MDRRAWQAEGHGVTRSQTRLSDYHTYTASEGKNTLPGSTRQRSTKIVSFFVALHHECLLSLPC